MATNQKSWTKISLDEYNVLRLRWRAAGLVPPYSNKGLMRGPEVLSVVDYDELGQILTVTVKDPGRVGYDRFFSQLEEDVRKVDR